jgi:hypothetical protein
MGDETWNFFEYFFDSGPIYTQSISQHAMMKQGNFCWLNLAIVVLILLNGFIHNVRSNGEEKKSIATKRQTSQKHTSHHIDPIIFTHNYKVFPNFTKVLVPSVYLEYEKFGIPQWLTNQTVHEKLGYSVFLYQKNDSSQPLFVRNRGTEGAVFLRYIVDHYDNFPDVAIFVHAFPTDHAPHWLEQIGCINPNASYININFHNLYRTTEAW